MLAALADELWSASISELVALIRSRAVSPVEIAGAALDRIALLNDQLLAFCAVDAELVLAQARQAERSLRAGDAVGPLGGVPLGVKDLIFLRVICLLWEARSSTATSHRRRTTSW